ncbi:MAG: hypothetical protein ACSLEG_00295 [Candidatus Carsonella ruddii]
MIYNIYIILKKKKNNIYSIFIKNLINYLLKNKIKIIYFIDFGYFFFGNKIIKIFFLKIQKQKKTILNIKKDFLLIFLILKKNINIFLLNLNLLSKYISKDFRIYSSIIKNNKYKNHLKLTKNIKILKILKIFPNNFIKYIKKINFFYDK